MTVTCPARLPGSHVTLASASAQLREVHQGLRDEQEEQYPPGPAELAAAEPEVMPSQMEAMDALQRTLKVGVSLTQTLTNPPSVHPAAVKPCVRVVRMPSRQGGRHSYQICCWTFCRTSHTCVDRSGTKCCLALASYASMSEVQGNCLPGLTTRARGRQMELVDEHMQMDLGGAPQNYWGLPLHPPPGEAGGAADEAEADAEVDEDNMSPAQVRSSSVR